MISEIDIRDWKDEKDNPKMHHAWTVECKKRDVWETYIRLHPIHSFYAVFEYLMHIRIVYPLVQFRLKEELR